MVIKSKLIDKCKELGVLCSQSMKKEKLIELINEKERVGMSSVGSDNITDVKWIYHLADIHIRYLERHDEYASVFSKFMNLLKLDNNLEESIVVICGDIFHTRDRFVSETIVLFDTFIRELTSLLPVFIIIGNHDCFNHGDRLDTISAIVDIAKYENLSVLKTSGFCEYRNIVFGVSSILDGKITQIKDYPGDKSGKVFVGLYHGMVCGSTLDNGMEVKGGLDIACTIGYDLFLLGDIHRRQFVGDTGRIAYPGSLIQQNFKEESSHGYLKWNTVSLTAQYIQLENDWSFIDIPMELDVSKIKFTKFSRIRFILSHEHVEADVQDKINKIVEVSGTTIKGIKKIMRDPVINKPEADSTDTRGEINSREDALMCDMLKDKPHLLDGVLNLHTKLVDEFCQDESNEESMPWYISKMEFKNIFSYGGDCLNTINFKDGITGILAKNASGKTSILNCIMYGLFGNIYRSQNHMNKNIISRFSKKDGLFVKLTINFFDGQVFYIERRATRKTRSRIKGADQTDISETLSFYTDDKVLDLSTKTDTEKYLRDKLSFIGKEEFILTNMMSNISYGKNMSIINMSGSELDDTFGSMFSLGKYKTLHKEAKVLCKQLSEAISNGNTKVDMINNQLLKYDESLLEKNISESQQLLERYTSDKDRLTNELEGIDAKLLKLKRSNTIQEDEDTLKAMIKENVVELSGVEKLLNQSDDIQKQYDILIDVYKKNDYKKLCETPKPTVKIPESVQYLSDRIQFLNGKIQTVELSSNMTNEYIRAKRYLKSVQVSECFDTTVISKKLNELEYNDDINCYVMSKDVHTEILKDLNKQYVDPSLLLKMKKIVEDKEHRDAIVSQNIEYEQEISALKAKLKQKQIIEAHESKQVLVELSDKLELLDLYEETEELKQKLTVVQNNRDISSLVSQKNDIMSRISAVNKKITEITAKMSVYNNDLRLCRELKTRRDTVIVPQITEKTKELEYTRAYVDITHSKNLPKNLISNVVKGICAEANTMIYNACGLTVDIQDNEKWEVVIRKGDFYIGPSSCSGYERFVLNTALKMSFDKYKQLSSIKLFLVDEVIDCVSEENFDNIDFIFEKLQNHYKKIIVISHNEELKRKINQRININVIDGCSSLLN
jgi:DNA repair exonuclease SbcCD ATPase subunit/DNA repair exonuclease SbcCD nuclease subunit